MKNGEQFIYPIFLLHATILTIKYKIPLLIERKCFISKEK